MPKWLFLSLPLLLLPGTVVADEADDAGSVDDERTDAERVEQPGYPQVSGNVGFGFTSASGNTESASTRLRASTKVEYVRWRHRFDVSGFRTEEGGETTADRRSGSAQSDLKISERSYLFANVNGERDRFGAFERRYSASLGVGRRLLDTTTMDLDLEVGAGRRYERAQDADETASETIGRFHGLYEWQFADNSSFLQDVAVEAGSDNTYTESETAVRSRLTDDLSWTLSYVVQHNSTVPQDRENTDSFTSLTLDYGF